MRLPILTLIIVFVLTVLVDWYILHDVRSYSSRRHRRRNTWIYIASVLPAWALLIVAACLPKRSESQEILPVMWILFTYLTIFVPKIIYCLFSLTGKLINLFTRSLVNYGAMIGFPIAILVCITMWWGVLSTRHQIQVREEVVTSSKLPKGFDGYRIIQFSDAHVGTWGNDTAFISELVNRINALNGDMVVFTGDIVNRRTDELAPFRSVLSRLKARDGVYSILGNHDYGDYMDWSDPLQKVRNLEKLKTWQTQMGWRLLDNTHKFVKHNGDSIALIGIGNWGEPPFKQYGDLQAAYVTGSKNSLNDANYKVLLSHNPKHWDMEVRNKSNIDLTLSGHTHAMQLEMDLGKTRLSPAVWRYKQWGGMYETLAGDGNPSRLYVNIGCGEVGMPMRIGAVPEITVLTLKSSSTANK